MSLLLVVAGADAAALGSDVSAVLTLALTLNVTIKRIKAYII